MISTYKHKYSVESRILFIILSVVDLYSNSAFNNFIKSREHFGKRYIISSLFIITFSEIIARKFKTQFNIFVSIFFSKYIEFRNNFMDYISFFTAKIFVYVFPT